MKKISRVHFITNEDAAWSIDQQIEILVQGGVDWIQLRVKNDQEDIRDFAINAREICNQHNCKLIINDNVHLAKEIGADGVHLGKEDMPVSEARAILGEEAIIGATANTKEDIQKLMEESVDYIGLGPYRFTETKKSLAPVLGNSGLKEMQLHELNIPVVVIGGVNSQDISAIVEAGAYGVAVSSVVAQSDNPLSEYKELFFQIDSELSKLV